MKIFGSGYFKGVGGAEYFASVFQNPAISVGYYIIFMVLTAGVGMGALITL